MFVALLAFSCYISIKDCQTHKISNKSLLFGATGFLLLASISGSNLQFLTLLICVAISPLLLLTRFGAGDVKLLAILALFFLPNTLTTLINFLTAISAISAGLILIVALRERTFSASIAFGPAICGAVIWCAR